MIFGPYPAKVLDVHDGDTVRLDIDLGFGTHQVTLACRLYGINAPELATPAGPVSRDFLRALLPAGQPVLVTSHGWDKYGGRFDGDLLIPGRSVSVNEQMVAAGQAKPL